MSILQIALYRVFVYTALQQRGDIKRLNQYQVEERGKKKKRHTSSWSCGIHKMRLILQLYKTLSFQEQDWTIYMQE